jgi:hypothetical protein
LQSVVAKQPRTETLALIALAHWVTHFYSYILYASAIIATVANTGIYTNKPRQQTQERERERKNMNEREKERE